MEFIQENLTLFLIPIISAVVGWFTNFLAVKMMFYPIEFIGIKPIFGWQGLIPMKRREMAEIEVELVLGKLLSVDEIAARLDPNEVEKKISRRLKQIIKKMVNELMVQYAPTLWAALPAQAKNLVYARIEMDIPNMVRKIVSDFQHNVHEILDIKELVVTTLVDNPKLINEIFLNAGAKEFPFIEKSGFYFGFLFGIPTMLTWYFYPQWWILPVCGLIVGYATNWIALKIIFDPKNPVKVGPFTIQGMFLKRQKEVARVYSDIVGSKVMNAENIVETVLRGSGSENMLELIELHVNDAFERYVAIAQPYFALAVGTKNYYDMKDLIIKRMFSDSDKFISYAHEYSDTALRIGDDLCAKMQELTPEEFEGVLRPAYQADEWKLIVTGALLGMAAGFFQVYFVFN